jgi:lysozyme
MDLCKRVLMFEEGFRSRPYLCPAGKSTIGFGHNLDANPINENDRQAMGLYPKDPLILTRGQGEVLLVRDINAMVVPAADRMFGPGNWQAFGEVRRAALGSMIYQLGESGLCKFRELLACVSRYDWPRAADAAMDSLWAAQTHARAVRHAAALRSGTDVWRAYR